MASPAHFTDVADFCNSHIPPSRHAPCFFPHMPLLATSRSSRSNPRLTSDDKPGFMVIPSRFFTQPNLGPSTPLLPIRARDRFTAHAPPQFCSGDVSCCFTDRVEAHFAPLPCGPMAMMPTSVWAIIYTPLASDARALLATSPTE